MLFRNIEIISKVASDVDVLLLLNLVLLDLEKLVFIDSFFFVDEVDLVLLQLDVGFLFGFEEERRDSFIVDV